MRTVSEHKPTDRDRLHLDALARVLLATMPGVPLRWDYAAGRRCLAIDCPTVGVVRVFVGKGWYWILTPRRALCPLTRRRRAARMLDDAVRRAAAREARNRDAAGRWMAAA